MKNIAIDLTWVRHGKVGGTESYIRNLLDGLAAVNPKDIKFYLFTSMDNDETFEKYRTYNCFEVVKCDVVSASQKNRIVWQNTKLNSELKKCNAQVCFEPIYYKPFVCLHSVKYITTIHDLQALHYPEYFSKARVLWMKLCWTLSAYTSDIVITISNYVREDILSRYHINGNKVKVIYNAIVADKDVSTSEVELDKYGVSKGEYYYTVSSLLPHKNLRTLVLMIAELRKKDSSALKPIVISGVGGKSRTELDNLISENGISDYVMFTDFIDDAERNMLYKNCKAFLFSSLFEGFGMPPIEAMAFGTPVVTTKCTSLEEVTGGLANYINDPTDVNSWVSVLENPLNVPKDDDLDLLIERYNCINIANQYLELFRNV